MPIGIEIQWSQTYNSVQWGSFSLWLQKYYNDQKCYPDTSQLQLRLLSSSYDSTIELSLVWSRRTKIYEPEKRRRLTYARKTAKKLIFYISISDAPPQKTTFYFFYWQVRTSRVFVCLHDVRVEVLYKLKRCIAGFVQVNNFHCGT